MFFRISKRALLGWCLALVFVVIASVGVAKDQTEPEELKTLLATLTRQEKRLGPNHPEVFGTLLKISVIYQTRGQYTEAESILKRVLSILEKALGPDHPSAATTLNSLAGLYQTQGRYAQAEPLYKRALKIKGKARGPDHPEVALTLNDLALLHEKQGHYAQAEPLFKRALAILEKAHGPDHPEIATTLNNLAELYRTQGHYAQAEPLYKRALKINEKVRGTDHPDVAASLNNLALLYDNQGHYAQAEPLYKRALAILEKSLGMDHPDVATNLNNLAALYCTQGNNTLAEPLLKRALKINEKAYGPNHPSVALSLNNLAALYGDQEALAFYKRSLDIALSTHGPDHPAVAMGLNNLLETYRNQGHNDRSEPLYMIALAIREKAFGPDHPAVAESLISLADLYMDQGNYVLSEPLIERALSIREKVFGPDHPAVATSMNNLAVIYQNQGHYALAELLNKRALAIREKAFGSEHPAVAMSLNNLAFLYGIQNEATKALEYIRAATSIYRKRLPDRSAFQLATEGIKDKSGIRLHLDLLAKARDLESLPNQAAEGFDLLQLIQGSDIAASVAQSAARHLAPNTKLAETVRRQQDAIQRYRHMDAQLIKSVSEPPGNRRSEHEAYLRTEIARLAAEIADVERLIAAQFPEYAALVSTEPLPLAEVQTLLREGEALVAFVSNAERTHIAIARREKTVLLANSLGYKELDTLVRRIRSALLADNPLTTPYDVQAAHALYLQLFAPLLPHLAGVRDLLVVADGPLSSLPMGVLLEEPATTGEQLVLKDYRNLNWLAKRFNFTTLPAVISLKALRKHGKPPAGDQQPFLGMGDPILEGESGNARGGKLVPLVQLFPRRNDTANVDALRKLPALPDTADELQSIAKTLGADGASIYLQGKATETNAKRLPLERYRVLAFATHSMVAGEAKDISEPGLVLTPPAKATPEDDGFLAASEVAQLNLNADWVVLSACNTAAPDGTPGATGLTGLAKSFLYAGARALLVSHWPVISSATTRLITDTFKLQADKPALGKSGALRQAMLNMINDEENPEYAHPAFWAPFVVVGDGR